jgi:putative transcription factor
MVCDLCGKETELKKVEIESVAMNVCDSCSQYGEAIKEVTPSNFRNTSVHQEDSVIEDMVENFGKLVKQAREKLNLKQKQLAKTIKEKESIIHKIENESLTPPVDVARKLEKTLNIKLITQITDNVKLSKHSDEALTLGDLIKKK